MRIKIFKRSLILAQITIITFFNNLVDVGVQGSLLYHLKAIFHFENDQYTVLLLIAGVVDVDAVS